MKYSRKPIASDQVRTWAATTKWRDLNDLWWLGTQVRAVPDPASDATIKQFLHNLSGYKTPDGMSPRQALTRFHAHNVDDLVKQGDAELRRWLPPHHWKILSTMDGVRGIVQYVDEALRKVEGGLQGSENGPAAPQAPAAKARRPKP